MTFSKEKLAEMYKTRIGYDPFEDGPTISVEVVSKTLAEWLVTDLIEAHGFEIIDNGGGTKVLRKGKIIVSGADGDLPSWNWYAIGVYADWENGDEPELLISDFSEEFPDMNEPRDFYADLSECERF